MDMQTMTQIVLAWKLHEQGLNDTHLATRAPEVLPQTDLPMAFLEPPELVRASIRFPLHDAGTRESCSAIDVKKLPTIFIGDGECSVRLVGQMPDVDCVPSGIFLNSRRIIIVRRPADSQSFAVIFARQADVSSAEVGQMPKWSIGSRCLKQSPIGSGSANRQTTVLIDE